jgi:hypothetical protein
VDLESRGAASFKMIGLAVKLRTFARLGAASLVRVGLYRLGLRTGLHPVHRISVEQTPAGAMFPDIRRTNVQASASPAWDGRPWAFGRPVGEPSDAPPDWKVNALTGARVGNADARWDHVTAFCPTVGDIKAVWEASRFDWAVTFAQRAVLRERGALDRLNAWLADWFDQNPAYRGPNWMCGQEASIRVLHLGAAALILGTVSQPSPPLQAALVNHLRRIRPTVAYALGQDNNHATSEAAALFLGGSWLAAHADHAALRSEGETFASSGRSMIEVAVQRLVFDDGGFAQYSVVYHRIMLDALALAEVFRRRFQRPAFSDTVLRKLALATRWLDAMVEPSNGNAPNLGANDGAWLLPVGRGGPRDFRPTLALASALFDGVRRNAGTLSSADILTWFEVDASALPESAGPAMLDFPDSGDFLIHRGAVRGWLRAPRNRFRPSQADALHLDLWYQGQALAVDSGTYSYADPDHGGAIHFGSVGAHNTVQFDDRDQMPRLGRFLLGEWIRATVQRISESQAQAAYVDHWGACHRRDVQLGDNGADVVDEVDGFKNGAVLRWRLDVEEVAIVDGAVLARRGDVDTVLIIEVDGRRVEPKLARVEVSEAYLQTRSIPVVEVAVAQAGTIVSRFRFKTAATPR